MGRAATAPARRTPRAARPASAGKANRHARRPSTADHPARRAGAASVALPARVLATPFARTGRARTGRVLDALLSGRGWIALVGLLLVGIVFFNVDLLRMNRDIARTAERSAALGRETASLRREVAELASSERIQAAAGELGLVLPAPGDVRYLRARPPADARLAAKRIVAPDPLLTFAPSPLATIAVAPASAPEAPAPSEVQTQVTPTTALAPEQ